jgi:hypothetical protein
LYGENLTKLLFLEKLEGRTTNILKSLFLSNQYKIKNPILDFYQNMIFNSKVLNKKAEVMDYEAMKDTYKANLLKIVNGLRDTVMLPKIAMNMADKH